MTDTPPEADETDAIPAGGRFSTVTTIGQGAMGEVLLAREPSLDPPDIRAWWPPGLVPPQVEIAGVESAREVMMLRPLAAGTLPLPPIEGSQLHYWHLDVF